MSTGLIGSATTPGTGGETSLATRSGFGVGAVIFRPLSARMLKGRNVGMCIDHPSQSVISHRASTLTPIPEPLQEKRARAAYYRALALQVPASPDSLRLSRYVGRLLPTINLDRYDGQIISLKNASHALLMSWYSFRQSTKFSY